MWPARITLFVLTTIHLILPFTPVNRHEEPRIKIAAAILGLVFLALTVVSVQRPLVAFAAGLALFTATVIVGSVGGASPLEEGWVVRLLFFALLSYGCLRSNLHTTNAIGG